MAACNHDCFRCPFPDCVEEGVTVTEALEADRRDRLLTTPEKVDAQRKAKAKARKKEITPEQQEKLRKKAREYRAAHREELNAKQRERYATDPAFREKCKKNTANYWRNVRKWYIREKRRERNDRDPIS